MSQPKTGVLRFEDHGLVLVYGKQAKRYPVPKDRLSPALKERWGKRGQGLDGTDVEFSGSPDTAPIHEPGEADGFVPYANQAMPSPASNGRRSETGGAGSRFRNPYNFVPTMAREGVKGELGDRAPVGHARYQPEHLSGRITVELTTTTPLLIPDAAGATTGEKDHKTFPLRVASDGRPLLPATSVKGMLRSAYEAVTNSRFGVFHHTERLAYRPAASGGANVVPVRVVEEEDGRLFAHLLPGTSEIGPEGRPKGPMYAAWLPRYSGERKDVDQALEYLGDGRLPEHGDPVWTLLEKVDHKNRWGKVNFEYWRVVAIERRTEGADRPSLLTLAPDDARSGRKLCGGWVYVSNANIGNKHDEKVFFLVSDVASPRIEITQELRLGWERLIADYQDLHRDAVAKRGAGEADRYLGREPGQTAFSRHVYDKDQSRLRHGTLCYAEVRRTGAAIEIVGLQPVQISRRLFPLTPADLLDESVRPAANLDQLSPADRVFGWVNPGGNGAYRGQIRVGPVECLSGDAIQDLGPDGLPLAILGAPKPTQARFYLGRPAPKTSLPKAFPSGLPKERAGYVDGNTLKGRKVYPHQRAGVDAWRGDATPVEARRAGGTPDNQNRSIKGWVKPETAFRFTVDLVNCSFEEAGALLWLLSLPEGHHLRLGGAKPLGFGSVRLAVKGCELFTGEAIAASLEQLSTIPDQPVRSGDVVERFKKAMAAAFAPDGADAAAFENVPFVKAFLRACEGYTDDLPTHYPRSTREAAIDGENFKWFGANDKERDRKPEHGYALGDLADDPGLPLLGSQEREPDGRTGGGGPGESSRRERSGQGQRSRGGRPAQRRGAR